MELQSEKKLTGIRRILSNVIQKLLFIDVAMISGYVSLACVWLILSAVLNPQVYLPYALPLVPPWLFMASKLVRMLGIFAEIISRIKFALARHMGSKLAISLKDLERYHLDFRSEFNADPILTDAVSIINSDVKLSSTLSKLELSVEDIISLAQAKDKSAIYPSSKIVRYGFCVFACSYCIGFAWGC